MPHSTIDGKASPPRVLFVDAYDSFTNNIVSLLETELGVHVTLIHIDDKIADLASFLTPFAAVIAGPGPGDPRNPEDVGLIADLWKLSGPASLLPVLGICLGFQSLVLSFGGSIHRLPQPRHGIVRSVRSKRQSIFRDHDSVETVQYHSLHASLRHSTQLSGEDGIWDTSSACPHLIPLAYDFECDNQKHSHSGKGILDIPLSEIAASEEMPCSKQRGQRCGANSCAVCDASKPLEESSSPSSLARFQDKCSSPPILMAVEHTSKPFVGLQFHPESICSSENARSIITSWWKYAIDWDCRYRSYLPISKDAPLSNLSEEINDTWNDIQETSNFHKKLQIPAASRLGDESCLKTELYTRVIGTAALSVTIICESLDLSKGDAIVLDSEMHQIHDVGQYSVIGVITPDTVRLEYKIGLPEIRLTCDTGWEKVVNLEAFGGCVFSFLKSFMSPRRAELEHVAVPFSGGLMGYITYEACLETIDMAHCPETFPSSLGRPDLSFAFIERSIVIDHFQHSIHVQSIKADDMDWVNDTTMRLQKSATMKPTMAQPQLPHFQARITLPDQQTYKSQVRTCQSSIRAGDSYELCLTTQVTIKTPTPLPSWPLYQRLRNLNPSPFSAYIRLGKLTLLSSSPERFLCWSRPTKHSKHGHSDNGGPVSSICQFRPIKGTVKRQPNPTLPPLNLAGATALLSTAKERAENLMIVDLIRHDLYGVVGSGRVSVPKLMVVEEYATLFQLVSVIEGTLAIEGDGDDRNNPAGEPLRLGNTLDQTVAVQTRASQALLGTVSDSTTTQPQVETHTDGSKTNKIPTCHLPSPNPPNQYKTGIDVLASSLPPGSMTGAPKRRSCQILSDIEQRERGVYSGIVGYMDIGGGGDFSVVIRSAFRWDGDSFCGGERQGQDKMERGGAEGKDGRDEDGGCDNGIGRDSEQQSQEIKGGEEEGDTWTIGAGGAVTILSTEDGEWEEMVAKLRSTLRLFEDGDGEQGVRHASHWRH